MNDSHRFVALAAILALLLGSCSLTPADPAADVLEAAAFVVEQLGAREGQALCVLRLTHDGEVIDETGAGGVLCNQELLAFNPEVDGFAGLLPAEGDEDAYRFSYAHESVTSSIDVPIPAPVEVFGLEDGAMAPRASDFKVTLAAPPGSVVEVVAIGPEGGQVTAIAGAQGAELDTSGFEAGPGAVRILRRESARAEDTGFATARWQYLQARAIEVVWR